MKHLILSLIAMVFICIFFIGYLVLVTRRVDIIYVEVPINKENVQVEYEIQPTLFGVNYMEQGGYFELPVSGATGWVAVPSASLRNSPQSDAEVYLTLLAGQGFAILEEVGEWWYVQVNDEQSGWISSYLCFINLPDVVPSIIYRITNDTLSVICEVINSEDYERLNGYECEYLKPYGEFKKFGFEIGINTFKGSLYSQLLSSVFCRGDMPRDEFGPYKLLNKRVKVVVGVDNGVHLLGFQPFEYVNRKKNTAPPS